jgi:hypothetical protein
MRYLTGILFLFILSGCAGGWTTEDKEKFRKDCINGTYSNLPEDKVKDYCDCYTEQMVKEYPVFNDALEHRDSAKNARMQKHCLHEIGME